MNQNSFIDKLSECIECMHDRIDKNHELVDEFCNRFNINYPFSFACIAMEIGLRIEEENIREWVFELSDEDYNQFGRSVYNSVLSFFDNLHLNPPNLLIEKEYMVDSLFEEELRVRALTLRGHEGLDDMLDILERCKIRLNE